MPATGETPGSKADKPRAQKRGTAFSVRGMRKRHRRPPPSFRRRLFRSGGIGRNLILLNRHKRIHMAERMSCSDGLPTSIHSPRKTISVRRVGRDSFRNLPRHPMRRILPAGTFAGGHFLHVSFLRPLVLLASGPIHSMPRETKKGGLPLFHVKHLPEIMERRLI